MNGYHYLMHIGHTLNVLAQYSERLRPTVISKGVQGFIKYLRDSLLHPWLEPKRLLEQLHPRPQLRLA